MGSWERDCARGGEGLLRLVNINNLKRAGNLKPSWYNIANRWLVLLQIACMCFVFMLRRKNAIVFSSSPVLAPLSVTQRSALAEREGPSLCESGALRDRERGQNWTSSVPGCNNRSEKDRVRGVSFHSLCMVQFYLLPPPPRATPGTSPALRSRGWGIV